MMDGKGKGGRRIWKCIILAARDGTLFKYPVQRIQLRKISFLTFFLSRLIIWRDARIQVFPAGAWEQLEAREIGF